jgi:hypothetical protein
LIKSLGTAHPAALPKYSTQMVVYEEAYYFGDGGLLKIIACRHRTQLK